MYQSPESPGRPRLTPLLVPGACFWAVLFLAAPSGAAREWAADSFAGRSDSRGVVRLYDEEGGSADCSVTAPGYARVALDEVEFRPGTGELPPIGAAAVPRGEIGVVQAELPPPEPAVTEVDAARRELSVLVVSTAGPVDASELTALGWHEGEVVELALTAEPVIGGLLARVRLAAGPLSTLQLVSPGAVSAELALEGGAADAGLEVTLLPAATMRAELIVPTGLVPPRVARLEARQCDAPETAGSLGTFPSRVEPKDGWVVPIPAGCVEATLKAEGFAPLELGAVRIPAHGRRDLGRLRLQAAASLLVRCLSGTDGLPSEGVEVFLVEPAAVAGAVATWIETDGQELPEVAGERRTSTGPRGWARFTDLAGGRFRVLALGAQGSVALSGEIELRAGAESALYELELPPPATVEIAVVEAEAVPDGASWAVLATGAASCDWLADTVLERTVGDSGSVTLGPLPPADWSFRLLLDDPKVGSHEVADQTLELEPGGFHRVELEAPGTVFSGEVTWLGEPVEARLYFRSGRDDSPGSTVAAARSSEDGTFTVLLKEPGSYDVDVLEESAEGRAARRTLVPEVPLEDPDEWVEIELPGGAVSGQVVDAWGEPVGGAAILAQQTRELGELPLDTSVRSGADGGFRLERLSAGRWTIRARTDRGRSQSARVELSEEEVRGGMLLTVREGSLEGRLSATGRPVAGASIWVTCLWAGLGDLCGGVARTGPDGSFSLEFGEAPEPAPVNLLVEAPGRPISAFRVSAGGAPIEIDLPAVGGRLTLAGDGSALGQADAGSLVLVEAAGGIVPAARGSILEAERGSGAGALVFPSLAPGSWRLYRVRDLRELESLQRGGGAGFPPIAAFQLPAGGAIEVTVGSGEAR